MAKAKVKGKANWARPVVRVLKRVGILGYSKKKNIYGVHPLVISTACIIFTLLLASISRKLVKAFFGNSESLVRQILLEFIATIELCAACFELIIVADNWGVGAYAIFLFLLTIWWSSHWEDATACPYNTIEEIIQGARGFKSAIFVILSQILAALITFRYVQIIWALELVETHRGRAFEDCTADLQVDMILGAVIEGVATCLCRLTSRVLSETDAKYGGVFDAFFATALVVAEGLPQPLPRPVFEGYEYGGDVNFSQPGWGQPLRLKTTPGRGKTLTQCPPARSTISPVFQNGKYDGGNSKQTPLAPANTPNGQKLPWGKGVEHRGGNFKLPRPANPQTSTKTTMENSNPVVSDFENGRGTGVFVYVRKK
ncbi:hypothetical protein NQ317_002268 [Molorchus minor]|uniref:Aquaporin n=1 Tax=Molorchus minor TaxID=1323400 RepID=A0ABQ9JWZ8_9CUCU|nr:hypothetical protein NQ317_002268 [Molorchus minor]